MPSKPVIHTITQLAETRLFRIEAVDLEFSNGTRCQFERMNKPGPGIVMVMPVLDDSLILIREYAVGSEQYELGLVKGMIDAGESISEAANRELKEEIGHGASTIQEVRKTRLTPHYSCAVAYLMLAEDLYTESCQGDEPEEMEQIHWPLSDLSALLSHPEISDVRTLHAIYWLRDHFK